MASNDISAAVKQEEMELIQHFIGTYGLEGGELAHIKGKKNAVTHSIFVICLGHSFILHF